MPMDPRKRSVWGSRRDQMGSDLKDIADFTTDLLPVVGDAKSAKRAYDAYQQGNYGDAAAEAGMTALGWVPFAGPLARGGIRAAKNIDMVKPAFGDPDYAKLYAREVAGLKGPEPKSVGASARFGEFEPSLGGMKVGDPGYIERLGLPPTADAKKAATAIAQDAARIARGAPEVGDTTSKVVRGFEPSKLDHKGMPTNPFDLVHYDMPSQKVWKEKFPNVPYPKKDAYVLTSKPQYKTRHNPLMDQQAVSTATGPGYRNRAGKPVSSFTSGSKLKAGEVGPVEQLMQKQGWSKEKAERMAKIMGLI